MKDKMNSYKTKERMSHILVPVILAFFMFLGLSVVNVKAETGFVKNDKGEYEIWDAAGFDEFKQEVFNGNKFSGETILLKNDISIQVDESVSTKAFWGDFEGEGHLINYSTDKFLKGKEVFPFSGAQGKVNNLKLNVVACELENTASVSGSLFIPRTWQGIISGVEASGTVKITLSSSDISIWFSIFDFIKGEVKNCSSNVIFDVDASPEILHNFSAYLCLSEFGSATSSSRTVYTNCFSYGKSEDKFATYLPEQLDEKSMIGITAFARTNTNCQFNNCYYDSTLMPMIYYGGDLELIQSKIADLKQLNQPFARTTEQMHSQDTYEGFDFEKYWEMSADKNNGYPYYSPREVTVTLDVKPVITEKKVWNTETPKDQNKYGKTNTYYYPYVGDTSVKIDHFEFANVTAKQQELIDAYGITADLNTDDIKSANVEMNYLGNRPVTVEWKENTAPELTVAKGEQAKEDGYVFKVNVLKGTCEVVDNGAEVAHTDDWYYQKAQEAIGLILKGGSYDVDNPCWNDNNVWFVFTAARCHYYPNGDKQYFDKWFANTKKKLQEMKDSGVELDPNRYNVYQKLVLTIEAIGYDPRDIDSYDLLGFISQPAIVNSSNYLAKEYTIHALKAAGYESEAFTNEDMDSWAHEKAAGIDAVLTESEDGSHPLDNADNFMAWQTLLYWYNKPGFEDVTKVIDRSFETKYVPMQVQRATGALCTAAYEQTSPNSNGIDGNNAWNDAQGLLYATTYDRDILDRNTGFIKNGNTILDATFDLINFETGSIPGFFWYEPAQIARGLDGYVRSYQRLHLNENTTVFWDFSDVPVPTKDVNDLILALDDNSTKAQITAARIAYDALDDAHKAIFNKDTLRKLLDAEGKGELIEKAVKAIDAIPAADQLTLEDKKTVEKARTLYDALDAESQAAVSNYSKLTEAEVKIAELEEKQAQETADRKAAESVSTAIASLPTAENLIPNDYVLKRLDEVQAAYDALTETQKALVENYETLQTLRTVATDKKAAAEVTEKINAIGTLNAGNHEQKQALVTEARTAYDALSDIQKGYVANYGVLEKAELFLSTCEKDKQAAYVMSVIDELNTVSKNMADGPLKLTEKNNGVPTEEIWKDWEDYVVNARAQYAALDAAQQEQVENLSDLEAAEGYVYQVKAEALKEQLEVLPDAATVKGYEAQPTEAPVETPEEITAETSAAEFDSDVFSDESADIFSTDTTEETQEADFAEMQDTAENDTPSADLRALTDEELTMITAAKNAYEQLTAAEEEKFRTENAALVENMDQLIALALTYPNGQESYQQQFAAEAAQLYAAVNPVSRDTYAAVKVLLDRYEKEYQPYAEAMAALKVEVNGQEMTFADVITVLKEQTAKAEKDIADAAEADQWILSIPTAVTKDNIHEVEADLASLQKYMDSMSEEARSYMWQNAQLALVRTIVADYHVELADKKDTFKASSPQNLKTKVLNYKTIQVSWTGTDYADSYNVYRKTGSGNWKKIASGITGVSYKDTKAVTGTTYCYTVRAVSYTWGKAALSNYDRSGVRGKAKLTAVSLTSVKNAGKNTVKVSWKKVTGANGYRVYRSTSKNGEYTSAGFIKKGSTVTFKDKKVSEGKTYYYKIRAYRIVNGKRVYGPYSAVKSVKAK